MLEIDAAREIVLTHARRRPAAPSPLRVGNVLAEGIAADLDSPPFAKALMDGYAARAADLAAGQPFTIIEEIAAGALPTKSLTPGTVARIFTGAKLPEGADAVVKQELAQVHADGTVSLNDPAATPGRNVMPRGREMRAGDVVLPAGTVMTPTALAVAATVGRVEGSCVCRPVVAVLTTGDELVPADVEPTGSQIRNSNGPLLDGLVRQAGGVSRALGTARDTETDLTIKLAEPLDAADVVLIAGGVSAGKFDLVPGVLERLGVTAHFHKVRMKPGKPLFFGTRGDTLVFGLPGNPVAVLVCFTLFVRPALRQMAGLPPEPADIEMTLTEPLTVSNDRPTFHPAKRSPEGVKPLPWFGSADLRAMLAADCLLRLPAGDIALSSGDAVRVVPL
jgi:molybdopterin molybdotransferase